jgi:hypothetical protein
VGGDRRRGDANFNLDTFHSKLPEYNALRDENLRQVAATCQHAALRARAR